MIDRHISLGFEENIEYYLNLIDYGELRNDTFDDGFDISDTVDGLTTEIAPDVAVDLPLFSPLPGSHVLAVQRFNESNGEWFNVSFTK